MSWSVNCVGNPTNVAKYLEEYSNSGISGQSLIEYNDAKPHLIELVKQNFTSDPNLPVINLVASGSLWLLEVVIRQTENRYSVVAL